MICPDIIVFVHQPLFYSTNIVCPHMSFCPLDILCSVGHTIMSSCFYVMHDERERRLVFVHIKTAD